MSWFTQYDDKNITEYFYPLRDYLENALFNIKDSNTELYLIRSLLNQNIRPESRKYSAMDLFYSYYEDPRRCKDLRTLKKILYVYDLFVNDINKRIPNFMSLLGKYFYDDISFLILQFVHRHLNVNDKIKYLRSNKYN